MGEQWLELPVLYERLPWFRPLAKERREQKTCVFEKAKKVRVKQIKESRGGLAHKPGTRSGEHLICRGREGRISQARISHMCKLRRLRHVFYTSYVLRSYQRRLASIWLEGTYELLGIGRGVAGECICGSSGASNSSTLTTQRGRPTIEVSNSSRQNLIDRA